jgi:pimeloyl-ACP methyl ester carboxylesterase
MVMTTSTPSVSTSWSTRFLHHTRLHTRDAQTRMYTHGDRSAAHTTSEEEMAQLKLPVLVVWCDGSGGNGRRRQRLASIIPGAQFKLLPETGFWAHWEEPATFNEAVRQFVMGEKVT